MLLINLIYKACTRCGDTKAAREFKARNLPTLAKMCSHCRAKTVLYQMTPEQRQASKDYARNKNQAIRAKVFDHYGRKCKCCGEIEDIFLTIDHVEVGGEKHRAESTKKV